MAMPGLRPGASPTERLSLTADLDSARCSRGEMTRYGKAIARVQEGKIGVRLSITVASGGFAVRLFASTRQASRDVFRNPQDRFAVLVDGNAITVQLVFLLHLFTSVDRRIH